MLTKRVIPCLDLRDGRVVKGVRFANLRDAGDPVEQAARYEEQGADEIVLLDVSATGEGRLAAIDAVRAVRAAISIPVTVGGGVRTVEDALGLLGAGADRVGINTAAVERPEILAELAQRAGSQCVVLSIDGAAKPSLGGRGPGMSSCESRDASLRSWGVVTHAGTRRTGIDVLDWAGRGEAMGIGEILLTSWDRDGTRCGYDLGLLRAVRGAVRVPIIASGGAAGAQHMVEALRAGADAVLAASVFHGGELTVGELKDELARAGMEVRR